MFVPLMHPYFAPPLTEEQRKLYAAVAKAREEERAKMPLEGYWAMTWRIVTTLLAAGVTAVLVAWALHILRMAP